MEPGKTGGRLEDRQDHFSTDEKRFMKNFGWRVRMKKYAWKRVALGLVLLWLGMVSLWAQTEPQKITVKAQDATIHARPDAGSQVIEKPTVGSVYEVVRKAGEWYEIKLPSRLGMVITGFIQAKFVEEPVKQDEVTPTPPQPIPPLPRRAKIGHISLGGLYHFLQMGYDYMYPWRIYNQDGAIFDSLYNQNVFGFQLGLGFFVLKNIEIDLGFSYLSKTLENFYAMEFPNWQKLDNIAKGEKFVDSKASEMMFNLGLNFHFLTEGRLRPYLGGGISYITGKMELLDDIFFIETFFLDKTHEIEITEVKRSGKTVDTLGFFGKAGIDVAVIEALSVFAEGRYLMAKKEVVHPLATKLSNGQEQLLEINLGGASAVLGVKIRF
jgi:opacity protein-like surface antigen